MRQHKISMERPIGHPNDYDLPARHGPGSPNNTCNSCYIQVCNPYRYDNLYSPETPIDSQGPSSDPAFRGVTIPPRPPKRPHLGLGWGADGHNKLPRQEPRGGAAGQAPRAAPLPGLRTRTSRLMYVCMYVCTYTLRRGGNTCCHSHETSARRRRRRRRRRRQEWFQRRPQHSTAYIVQSFSSICLPVYLLVYNQGQVQT